MNKQIKYLFSIIAVAGRNVLSSMSGFVISILVIRFFSAALWGRAVEILLIVNMANHILHWGSKEYLLRAFSRAPGRIPDHLNSSIITRSFLAIAIIPLTYHFLGSDSSLFVPCCILIFLRYIISTNESLVQYHKKFNFSFVTDIFSLAISLLYLYYNRQLLRIDDILMAYILSDLFRLICQAVMFGKEVFDIYGAKPSWEYLVKAFPFFLFGLGGFLRSRSDQFVINHYLSDTDKAFYQVYMNFLMFVISAPSYLIAPLVGRLYRAGAKTFRKLALWLYLGGLVAVPAMVFMIILIMRYIYQQPVSITVYILGIFVAYPSFLFSIVIYEFFRKGLEKMVTLFSFISVGINLLICFLLIPVYGYEGGLMASGTSHWCMFALLAFYRNRSQKFKIKAADTLPSNLSS